MGGSIEEVQGEKEEKYRVIVRNGGVRRNWRGKGFAWRKWERFGGVEGIGEVMEGKGEVRRNWSRNKEFEGI